MHKRLSIRLEPQRERPRHCRGRRLWLDVVDICDVAELPSCESPHDIVRTTDAAQN